MEFKYLLNTVWSRLDTCGGGILLGDLNPGHLSLSLLSRKPTGAGAPIRVLSLIAYEGLVARPLPASPSPGSSNTGVLSISGMNLALCCYPIRTSPPRAAGEAAPPPSRTVPWRLALAPGPLAPPPQVLPSSCLPDNPSLTSLVFDCLVPLFQPPNAMAALGPCHLLGWPHLWKVLCKHSYSVATASYFSCPLI